MNHHLRPDVAALGRITTVWAHPDDETYLAGGLMSMARCLGQPVTCVTATPGDLAATDVERRRIAHLRSAELLGALDVLDVHDVVTLGLPDGGCDVLAAEEETAVVARLAAVLRDRRPDTIVTFGPDGFTGHPDHRAVSRWTVSAAKAACPGVRILFPAVTPWLEATQRDVSDRFGVFAPGLPAIADPGDVCLGLQLNGRWLDRKVKALRAHASQTTGLVEALGLDRYGAWVGTELFVDASTVLDAAGSQPTGARVAGVR